MRRRVLHGVVTGVLVLVWFVLLTPIQNHGGDAAALVWWSTFAVFLASRAGLRALHERRLACASKS